MLRTNVSPRSNPSPIGARATAILGHDSTPDTDLAAYATDRRARPNRLLARFRRLGAAVALVSTFVLVGAAPVAAATATVDAYPPNLLFCSRAFNVAKIYTEYPWARSSVAQVAIVTAQLRTVDTNNNWSVVVASVSFDGFTYAWQGSTSSWSRIWYSARTGSQMDPDLWFSVPDKGYFYYRVRFVVKWADGQQRIVWSPIQSCPPGV